MKTLLKNIWEWLTVQRMPQTILITEGEINEIKSGKTIQLTKDYNLGYIKDTSLECLREHLHKVPNIRK